MREHVFFHLTGDHAGASLASAADLRPRPALFARFGDLTRLRYDFPLVLVEGDGPFAETLSGLVDAALREVAPRGIGGERLRRNALRLEREIRAMLAGGACGTLSALWDRAAQELVANGGEPVMRDLATARAAIRVDGPIVDCDATLPGRFVEHAWTTVHERKVRRMRREIDALAIRLADLVRADLLRSESGRRADTLRSGIGRTHRELFDFDSMARLLAAPSGGKALPERRRERIAHTLTALRAQRFFGGERPYTFVFDRVDAALSSFRERLPAMAELVRAISVAELELEGRSVEAKHEEYFDAFDERSLGPSDLAAFPDYLVRIDARASDSAGRARLIEGLASGAPLKILLETADAPGPGAQLATTTMGLGDVFVLQSTSSNLFRVAPSVRKALEYAGAALVSVFAPTADGLSQYLVSAAAMESRAFPAFVYDPSLGSDWAHRFSLLNNPQPDLVWPVHDLMYADDEKRRVTQRLPFTAVDFALCDRGRSHDFGPVARADRSDGLVPVGDWLETTDHGPDTAPFAFALDSQGRLRKLVVDERLVRSARKCAEAWQRLRELSRIGHQAAAPTPVAQPSSAVASAPAAASVVETAAEQRTSDDAYIETPRCTSCNECTAINDRMFAFNDNKQAYIADLGAGTYRELIEAAESCQVAIIHPGKPRNAKEPGLEELLQRAEAFR